MIHENNLVTLHVENQFVALSENNYTAQLNSLDNCYIMHEDTYACHLKSHIKNESSCIGVIMAHKSADSPLCTQDIYSAKIQSDFVIKLDDTQILVVPHTLTNVSLSCIPKWRFSVLIKQPSIIKVYEPCTLLINNLMFIETPIKMKTTDVTDITEIKIDPTHHKIPENAPTFPKLIQARLESIESLGVEIKTLNDRELNTPFFHKLFNHDAHTSKIINVSIGTIILLIIILYCCIKCECYRCLMI